MTSHKRRRRSHMGDAGQAALVLVVSLAVLLTGIGAILVNVIGNNDPIVTQAAIRQYAYRALASGVNSYQSVINGNPYLASCNSATNYPNGSNASAQCAGINYQTWTQVPGTDLGNGVIPEFYKFDNPQQVIDPTTKAITYIEVQIVGAAGFPGKNVFYSTVAKFTPQNTFLNVIWWTNFEQFNSTGNPPNAANCSYYWTGSQKYQTGVGCGDVYFITQDTLNGPVFSNDSIPISGTPTFNGKVLTADPSCLFVSTTYPGPPGCSSASTGITYGAGSAYNQTVEPLPTTNAQLGDTAKQGGCYYQGPTTITLETVSGVGKMLVKSPDTPGYPNAATTGLSINTSSCPTNGTTAADLPINGVLYVDQATSGTTGANPFSPNTGGTSQVQSNCSGCYYGQTASPDTEGDAFVSDLTTNGLPATGTTAGGLSGHLTIGAANDVIITGPITYADCTWAGTAHQSLCNYNNATTGTNDVLGLIANNFLTINRPVYNSSAGANAGKLLPNCGSSGALAAPLCNPSTATGANGSAGLIVDATVLALKQSFIVNNYNQSNSGSSGSLLVYGSIQQNARGPVGTFSGSTVSTGYAKGYYYDPRLTLYGPPYYLTPGTASWALVSSAETYTGIQPSCPPPQATPVTAVPTFPITGSTAAGTGNCIAAS